MQTKFRRHQKVKLLITPSKEYIEYRPDHENEEIKKGMAGKINMLLPNGQYHVEVLDEKGDAIAYVPLSEDDLEETE